MLSGFYVDGLVPAKRGLWGGVSVIAVLALQSCEAVAQCVPTPVVLSSASSGGFDASGGAGPPSLSATEVSTAQALQFIQKRRNEALTGGAPLQVAAFTPQAKAVEPPVKAQKPQPLAPGVAPVAKAPLPAEPKIVALPKPATSKPELPSVKEKLDTAEKPSPAGSPSVVPLLPPAPPAPVEVQTTGKPAAPADTPQLPAKAGAAADKSANGVPVDPKVSTTVPPAQAAAPAEPNVIVSSPKPTATPPKAGIPSSSAAKTYPVAGAPTLARPPSPVIVSKAPRVTVAAVDLSVAKSARPVEHAPVVAHAPIYQVSLKDSSEPFVAEPTHGAWATAYFDHEYHSGLTLGGGIRGELSSSSKTFGTVSGTDRVVSGGGTSRILIGVIAGLSETNSTFGDVAFGAVDPATGLPARFNRSNATEHIGGGGGGFYAVAVDGKFSADVMFKVDGYGIEQKDTTRQQGNTKITSVVITNPCIGPQTTRTIITDGPAFATTDRSGQADLVNTVLSANAAYRFSITADSWFEPTFGARYTHASYSNQQGTLPLGYIDGDALRIQGGVRIGSKSDVGNGSIMVTTLTGMVYSDVIVDGFGVSTGGFNPAAVDEGKVRRLGQISVQLVKDNGLTYLVQGEIRGGEDVFGVGGKIGFRAEW